MDGIYHSMYLVVLAFQIGLSHAGKWCSFDDRHEYCDHGCCERNCCVIPWLVWAIIGGVCGGMIIISFIICLICVCMKKKIKQGRVIQPDEEGSHPPPYGTIYAMSCQPDDHAGNQQVSASQQPTASPPHY